MRADLWDGIHYHDPRYGRTTINVFRKYFSCNFDPFVLPLEILNQLVNVSNNANGTRKANRFTPADVADARWGVGVLEYCMIGKLGITVSRFRL